MGDEEKNESVSPPADIWAELLRGPTRPFTDPETGEVIMEQPIVQPSKRKAVDDGFVMVNMEAMARAAQHLGGPGMVILMETARQWRMGNGAVAVTAAFGARFGMTERRRRSAVADLVELAKATGWVRVSQDNHRAPRVEMTAEGMRRVWRAATSAATRTG
jgi:hypothetical protein